MSNPPEQPKALGALTAAALVFWTSAAVLVLEILAARLLAPYVGVTLQTYTGIIGVVLAGIALGTRWGGHLADNHDPARLLGPAIVAGGALALVTVPLIRALGPPVAGGGFVAIVTLSVAGFFAPAVVLSTITPLVIKLELRSLAVTGSVVGRLSAIGTVGAIFGTFMAGFVLIVIAPTSVLIPGLGVALVATGVGVWLLVGRTGATQLLTSLVFAAIGLTASIAVASPCELETRYYCVRVVPDPQRDTGRTLVLDDLRHSYVDLADPTHLEFAYIHGFAAVIDAAFPAREPVRAVHVGGGGFTLPRWLAATRPGSDSVVLELDPGIVDVAVRRLGLQLRDDLRAVTGDARLHLDGLPAGAHDLVAGDAFGGVAVPWHLTTVEVVRAIDRLLTGDGVYVINVIDRGPMRFARAETATLQAVFDHVAVLGSQAALDGFGGNLVLIGSRSQLDLDAIRANIAARGEAHVLLHDATLEAWVDNAQVLTDDYAPVDQLITQRVTVAR